MTTLVTTLACFRRLFFVLAVLTPSVVFAHPGHDGGHGDGLTWDFVGEVLHRLSSPYHLAPAVALGVIGVVVWRRVRAKREGDARK